MSRQDFELFRASECSLSLLLWIIPLPFREMSPSCFWLRMRAMKDGSARKQKEGRQERRGSEMQIVLKQQERERERERDEMRVANQGRCTKNLWLKDGAGPG
ncbi:hypothetical protein EUGRSUZ_H02609 [Eucalyptus grandis]|uniref:Uncharacterized protein n=2 Tax=Eucalyptus grandis TaxID=71139 RepID=A0ACC3JTF6_EUCGR|nr:hypothetical protein EUGRSUZ_H02609 [Eucalyptus grandis]